MPFAGAGFAVAGAAAGAASAKAMALPAVASGSAAAACSKVLRSVMGIGKLPGLYIRELRGKPHRAFERAGLCDALADNIEGGAMRRRRENRAEPRRDRDS